MIRDFARMPHAPSVDTEPSTRVSDGAPACRVCNGPVVERHNRLLGVISWRCHACGHVDGRGSPAPAPRIRHAVRGQYEPSRRVAERRVAILELWHAGFTRRAIAETLDLDYSTVARTVRGIYVTPGAIS